MENLDDIITKVLELKVEDKDNTKMLEYILNLLPPNEFSALMWDNLEFSHNKQGIWEAAGLPEPTDGYSLDGLIDKMFSVLEKYRNMPRGVLKPDVEEMMQVLYRIYEVETQSLGNKNRQIFSGIVTISKLIVDAVSRNSRKTEKSRR